MAQKDKTKEKDPSLLSEKMSTVQINQNTMEKNTTDISENKKKKKDKKQISTTEDKKDEKADEKKKQEYLEKIKEKKKEKNAEQIKENVQKDKMKAMKDLESSEMKELDYSKEAVNLVFIGHVDAGKSTISGNIMLLTGQIDARTKQKYEEESKANNRESWWLA